MCAWVKKLQSLEYNIILSFKPQGEIGTNECSILKTEDYLLVVQTQFQYNTLKKYANKAVLLDSTHVTTAYDFFWLLFLLLMTMEDNL